MAVVDRPPGYEHYGGDHRYLVDARGVTTRKVGVADRTESVGGGEGGCGLQVVGPRVAGLRGFEAPSCWWMIEHGHNQTAGRNIRSRVPLGWTRYRSGS